MATDDYLKAVEAFRADPTIQTGNRLLQVVRETLHIEPQLLEDPGRWDHVNNTELANTLEHLCDFTPTAGHWALNLAALRLRTWRP